MDFTDEFLRNIVAMIIIIGAMYFIFGIDNDDNDINNYFT